jgi:hypothetical protein
MEFSSWLKEKLQKDKISVIAACPVYDTSDKFLLGFVEIIYMEPDYEERTFEEIELGLLNATRRISVIISKQPIK